ncbi:MAG: magnesium chelatase [Saprospiraceae bacterium]|nr:MAG: magnesium chelatase [Saprospiraceae bacterium]
MHIDEINENEASKEIPSDEEQPKTIPAEEEFVPAMPPSNTGKWQRNNLDLTKIEVATQRIREELGKVIIGQSEYMDLLLAALFAGGHVLVEGVPGIAKTLTAKLIAKTLEVDFSRIQFTPDLMPSDVIGTTVFNLRSSEFSFKSGPIFSNLVLIDEINRAPAKTQAALFEVMEEYQVTVDGETYKMEFPFFVIATQNPIEQEGTYKLPEAQLDRFLVKINLEYPALEEEKAILRRFRNDFKVGQLHDVKTVFSAAEVLECQKLVEQVYIKDELLDYIAAIVINTRNNGDLFLGASPRASLAIMRMAKAIAAANGRDFVTPEDIQYVAYPVLNHRIILTPEREMEGLYTRDVIEDIIKKIEVPR